MQKCRTPKSIRDLNKWLAPLQADERIGPVHIAMYLALLQCSTGRRNWFNINRIKIMKCSKIKGINTYYRTIRQLAEMNLIKYHASRNHLTGSRALIAIL